MTNPFVAHALSEIGMAPVMEAHLDAAIDDILADSAPIADADKCEHCRGTGRKPDVQWLTNEDDQACPFPERPSDEQLKQMVRERLEAEDAAAKAYIENLRRELLGE